MAEVATLQIKVDSTDATQATKALEGMAAQANFLEKAITRAAAVFGLFKFGELATETIQAASRFETLGVVMTQVGMNAGHTGAYMKALQKDLMDTGISALEARNTLSMAAAAQIDLSKTAQMARIAQDAAVIGNMNSSEAFATMIHGIQTGQAILLHHIGLMVNFEEAYKRQAEALHKNVKDLTDHEKALARQNETMSKGPQIAGAYEAAMGTAGKQMKSMERYVQDLQVKVGSLFMDPFTQSVFGLSNALKAASEWFDRNRIAVLQIKEDIKGTATGIKDLAGAFNDLLKVDVKSGISAWEVAFKGLNLTVAALADAMNLVVGSARVLGNFVTGHWGSMDPGGKQAWSGFRGENSSRAYYGTGQEDMEAMVAKIAKDDQLRTLELKRAKESRAILAANEKAAADKLAAEAAKQRAEEIQKLLKGFEKEAYFSDMSRSQTMLSEAAEAGLSRKTMDRVVVMSKVIAQRELEHEQMKYRLEDMKAEERLQAQIRSHGIALLDKASPEDKAADERKKWTDFVKAGNVFTPEESAAVEKYLFGLTESGKTLKHYNDELEREATTIKSSVLTAQEQMIKDEERLDIMRRKGLVTQEEYIRQLVRIRQTGLDTFATLLDAMQATAKGMEDAFVQFAMTGKFAFKDMANAIIADLIRMQSSKAFAQLLGMGQSWLGQYFGGSGQISNPDGSGGTGSGGEGLWTGWQSAPPGGGGTGIEGGVSVNVNVNNQGQSEVSSDASGAAGKKLGDAIGKAVQAEIINQKRPGGLLWGGA